MPLTAEQKAARKLGLGGSDAPILAGLMTRFGKDAKWLWMIKTGQLEPEPENEAMRWGNLLEPVIAAEIKARHEGWELLEMDTVTGLGTPFILCHPDRLLITPEREGVVEIKNTRYMKAEPPDYYVCQLQWNMMVCDLDWGVLAVLVGGAELKIFEYERDLDVQHSLTMLAKRFWPMVVTKEWRDEWATD